MKVWTPPPPEKFTTPEPVKPPENMAAELLVGVIVLVVETAATRLFATVRLLTSMPPASVTGPLPKQPAAPALREPPLSVVPPL